jgi:hypothetical protein
MHFLDSLAYRLQAADLAFARSARAVSRYGLIAFVVGACAVLLRVA